MKGKFYILILVVFSFTKLQSQKLIKIQTTDLIQIANEYGLDSALNPIIKYPIDYIDSLTTIKLIREVNNSTPSNTITIFLTDYSLKNENPELKDILFNYYSKLKNNIEQDTLNEYGSFWVLGEEELLNIIKYSDNRTERLLIEMYNEWNIKSFVYLQNYSKGITQTDKEIKKKLTEPFYDINLNCYRILIALKSLQSQFADSNKLKAHSQYLKVYHKDTILKESQVFHFFDWDFQRKKIVDTIDFSKNIESLSNVKFKSCKLRKIFKYYKKRYCKNTLIYNKKQGFLSLACIKASLNAQGIDYFLEIKGNKLIIYEISRWQS